MRYRTRQYTVWLTPSTLAISVPGSTASPMTALIVVHNCEKAIHHVPFFSERSIIIVIHETYH